MGGRARQMDGVKAEDGEGAGLTPWPLPLPFDCVENKPGRKNLQIPRVLRHSGVRPPCRSTLRFPRGNLFEMARDDISSWKGGMVLRLMMEDEGVRIGDAGFRRPARSGICASHFPPQNAGSGQEEKIIAGRKTKK